MELFKFGYSHYEGNSIWCTAFHDPHLYKIDLETKRIEQVTTILEETDNLRNYINFLVYKNNFIFIPDGEDCIIIMNRDTFQKERYDLTKSNLDEKTKSNIVFFISSNNMNWFVNGIINNDILYIFGTKYDGIVKFDLINKKSSLINDYLKDLKINSPNVIRSIYHYVEFDNKLYIPFTNTNAVLEFSLSDESTKIHYVGSVNQRYISCALSDGDIWLVPFLNSEQIIKWNPKTNNIKEFDVPIDRNNIKNVISFGESINILDYIVVLSLNSYKDVNYCNLKIDTKTEKIEVIKDLYEIYASLGSKYACVNVINADIYFLYKLKLIKYNIETNSTEIVNLIPSENIIKYSENMIWKKNKYLFENSNPLTEHMDFNLNNLITYLKCAEADETDEE